MTTQISWHPSSPIVSLRSIAAKEGHKHTVYLYANMHATTGSMDHLIHHLQQTGYDDLFPDVQDGKPCLAIRQVANAEDVAALLEQGGWAEGIRNAEHTPDATIISPSFIRQYAVKGTALGALSGTLLRGTAALMQHHYSYLPGASLNILQQAIQIRYGTGTGSTAEELLSSASSHLREQGVMLPEQKNEAAHSLFHRMDRLLERYPVPISYGIGIPMGASYLYSGIQTRNPWLMYGGAVVVTGASVITFVPEKRMSPDEQEESITQDLADDIRAIPSALVGAIRHPLQAPGNFWSYIQESPKRFAATLMVPFIATGWFDAIHQIRNVRVRWPQENPAKIKFLEEEIAGLTATPSHSNLHTVKHLGKLEANLKTLNRQLELSRGMGRSIIPAILYTSRFTSLATLLFQSIATKNRLSQQTDMTNFDKLYSLSAQALLALPEAERGRAYTHVTDFFASQPDVLDGNITPAMLKEGITARLEVFKGNNPWIAGHATTYDIPAQAGIRR